MCRVDYCDDYATELSISTPLARKEHVCQRDRSELASAWQVLAVWTVLVVGSAIVWLCLFLVVVAALG